MNPTITLFLDMSLTIALARSFVLTITLANPQQPRQFAAVLKLFQMCNCLHQCVSLLLCHSGARELERLLDDVGCRRKRPLAAARRLSCFGLARAIPAMHLDPHLVAERGAQRCPCRTLHDLHLPPKPHPRALLHALPLQF